jgi:hypothetical protein
MKRLSSVLLLLLMSACADSNLQTVSKDMLIVSTALGQLQSDLILANQNKLLDDPTTARIMKICIQANVAGRQVDAVLRGISKLDPQSRSSVIALLTPISQALDPTQLEFVAGIKNPETKQKIDGAFILMRTTISGIQIVLASGGA